MELTLKALAMYFPVLSFLVLFTSNPATAQCPNPCGYYSQLCCAADEYCYTDSSNQAQCGKGTTTVCAPTTIYEPTTIYVPTTIYGPATCPPSTSCITTGEWSVLTETYFETEIKTIVKIYNSYYPSISCATPGTCKYELGEVSCGAICCSPGQYCAASGECVFVGGVTTTTFVETCTSQMLITITSIGSEILTIPYQTPEASSSG